MSAGAHAAVEPSVSSSNVIIEQAGPEPESPEQTAPQTAPIVEETQPDSAQPAEEEPTKEEPKIPEEEPQAESKVATKPESADAGPTQEEPAPIAIIEPETQITDSRTAGPAPEPTLIQRKTLPTLAPTPVEEVLESSQTSVSSPASSLKSVIEDTVVESVVKAGDEVPTPSRTSTSVSSQASAQVVVEQESEPAIISVPTRALTVENIQALLAGDLALVPVQKKTNIKVVKTSKPKKVVEPVAESVTMEEVKVFKTPESNDEVNSTEEPMTTTEPEAPIVPDQVPAPMISDVANSSATSATSISDVPSPPELPTSVISETPTKVSTVDKFKASIAMKFARFCPKEVAPISLVIKQKKKDGVDVKPLIENMMKVIEV